MTLRNSFPTDLETGLPVLDTRLTLSTLVARDTDGNPRVGVVPDSLDPIVSGRSNMSYSVRSFRAITSRTGNGVELVANDGATTVSTTAAPSANARYDIIYVRARFSLNGDGSSAPEIGVVQGTAALNPSRPGVPAGAFALAEAYIPAGVSSTTSSGVVVTPVHPWTAAAGGTVVVRSQAELDAWTPADGSRAFNVADNGDYVRVSGEWATQAGVWKSLTLNSPYTGTAEYKRELNTISFRATYNELLDAGTAIQVLTMPAGARPTMRHPLVASGSNMRVVSAYADTTGIIRLRVGDSATTPYLYGMWDVI